MSIILRGCAVWLLWVCLAPVQAHNGMQTAAQLNTRFNSTPAQCVGRTPAFTCSGVLIGAALDTPTGVFWQSQASGGTTRNLVLLRKDRNQLALGSGAGFLLFDRLTAVGQGKAYRATQSTVLPLEVTVSDWNENAPATLPIQGVYYDTRHPKGVLRGQRSQRAFYQATGVWLPLLRLQLDDARGQVFGFSQHDQLDEGFRLARRLNARVADASGGDDACRNDSASFYCRGVLVRATDVGNFRAWDPSPSAVRGNGVSFSYFRADTKVLRTYKPQGFVIRESAAPARQAMNVRCIYPFDGHTGGQADICGFRPTCAAKNITSVQAWLNVYQASPNVSCAFSTSPKDVHLASDVRSRLNDSYGWNELVLAAWPTGVPQKLPLEAFFYSMASHVPGDGFPGGRLYQLQYFSDTGRTLPLMRFQPMHPQGQLFSYRPDEQALE